MRQQPLPRDTFFSLKNDSQILERPISVATEFVDTDWEEEDEIISDEEDNSPRISLQSAGQPSFTTVSSYDEVPTPRSSRSQEVPVEYSPKQVEGPRGPHLFRNSSDQYSSTEDDIILTLSPITPKGPRNIADFLITSQPPLPRASPFQYTDAELDTTTLASWTTEMVAQAMLNAGVELSVADRFMENDISGAILITLKFEDLKELSIQSFGIRTKVWHQIQALRDSRPASPRPETPIEDVPSKEVVRETRRGEESGLKRRQSSKRRHRARTNGDDITPMESVSIIGIEQVIPKPHNCSKGENCSKYKKQQQLIRAFKKEYPHVDINATGTVMIGDAGNPETAKALDPNKVRPVSDAVPSVVASSDVMGPGMPPLQYLYEASLRGVQSRDPQDNVRQFLSFQHQHQGDCSAEVPPTPPFDGMPTAQAQLPHQGLRRLPKLSIPGKPQLPPSRLGASSVPPPPQKKPGQHQSFAQHQQQLQQQQQQQPAFVPYQMEKTSPRSPDLEMTPRNSFRHGTPFSELDVPITAVPVGPVARDFSQSVPPDMNYRTSPTNNVSPPRCQSRTSARRPSFPVMPSLEENKPVFSSRPAQGSSSPRSPRGSRSQQPLQPPPRDNLPFSRGQLNGSEKTLAPSIAPLGAKGKSPSADPANGISHQGPMKKRKTKMLRHEWQDGYFTLKGTRLNMHKDAEELDRTLEYVDIDDYAIACSSVASSSKLSAAFKTMHLSRGSHSREKSDPVGAFAFQLVPQDKNTARLRKRESHLQPAGAIPAEGVNGTGKTHHFAVKNRDDRIDWMRELMLAKALRQKGEGFEISVNGNMI
ncbi:Protein pob1 [Fusarium austroafricanum]|uniref:Protein pob1 n=1 Tax=Fusarium austroafricanum TaxID=2364996 RepID=A0A8H4NKU7_9HYPO|nr:Protein pob1 [Fusarium austroafricanum]